MVEEKCGARPQGDQGAGVIAGQRPGRWCWVGM